MKRNRYMALVLALLALGSAACGDDAEGTTQRAVINRVPPGAIPKSFFVGSLDDESDDPSFSVTGQIVTTECASGVVPCESASLGIVTWRVSLDLIGAVAQENALGGGFTLGDTVIAYRILEHFDITTIRDVEHDVLMETEDRPYPEREYIRVDWGYQFSETPYAFVADYLGVAACKPVYEGLSFYVTDLDSPDAPHLDVESGTLTVTDVVYVTPTLVDKECPFQLGEEVKVRFAFQRE